MDQRYYIRSRGRVEGPFSPARLKELAKRGKFGRHHHISLDRETWERASAHPELFPDAGPSKLRRPEGGGDVPGASQDTILDGLDGGGSDFDREWFYSQNGQQVDDPVSLTDLKQLATSGKLLEDDFVWTDGMDEWVEASRVIPASFDDSSARGPSDPAKVQLPTAPLAVASFVLSLLGATIFFYVGSILAVIFGHTALMQIRQSDGGLGGRGLAIAGLILGYVVLVIGTVVGVVLLCIHLLKTPAATP